MNIISEHLDRFFYWINERHAIYWRRWRGDDWPWTDDDILQTYKFTNVFRELDRGTVWCREHIRKPYSKHPELFFNIAAYRRYNWIGTAEELGYIEQYDPEHYTAMMLARQAQGEKIFTGAHMICGTIRDEDGSIPKSKVVQIFKISFSDLWNRRRELEPQPGDTLEMAYNRLMDAKVPGYGAFICYEVVTDLRWTRYLENASDINTWANPGPGAKRGVCRLMGLNVIKPAKEDRQKYPKNDQEYIDVMRWLLIESYRHTEDWVPPLEMRDIEHSLCEWDKYERARLKQGAPRSRFIPPHERRQV